MTRTECTAWLTANEVALEAAQEAGLVQDGKYRQVLAGGRKPMHRASALGATVAPEFVVDEYEGPRGKGWTVTLHADEAGVAWVRMKDYGAEGRTHAWRRA